MKEWHFYDKVYRVWVVVLICSPKELEKFLKDATFTDDIEEMDISNSSGYCITLNSSNTTNGNNCSIIWMKKKEFGVLVHELTHLAMMVFGFKGVPVREENGEAFAYYVEFWFNEIRKVMSEYPKGRSAKETR